jgi:hypothetical protein
MQKPNLSIFKNKTSGELIASIKSEFAKMKKSTRAGADKRFKAISKELDRRVLSKPQSEKYNKVLTGYYLDLFKTQVKK